MSKIFAVRLDKGEEINAALAEFCSANGIETALVSGVGGLSKVKIYSVTSNDKLETNVTEYERPMELVSLLGNVTMKDGKPSCHLHAVLAFDDHNTKGGHLLEGVISHTGEIFLTQLEKTITRQKDESSGLWKMKF